MVWHIAQLDATSDATARHDALHQAIARAGGSCAWTPIHTGWIVTLEHPEARRFFGLTLEEALTWCLGWLLEAEAGDR